MTQLVAGHVAGGEGRDLRYHLELRGSIFANAKLIQHQGHKCLEIIGDKAIIEFFASMENNLSDYEAFIAQRDEERAAAAAAQEKQEAVNDREAEAEAEAENVADDGDAAAEEAVEASEENL